MEKNPLQQRVIARLSELNIGPVEAAERISGLERNYIRDLVGGKKQSFSQAKLPLVAQALEWTVGELLEQSRNRNPVINQGGSIALPPHPSALQVIPNEELMGKIDLPVYSIVQGGLGAQVLENEPFTHIARPKRLIGVKKAYGVLVRGDSCAKEYNDGDIAFVDPHLHARKGDPCVFQGERPDGTVEAILKYLERSPDASETVYYVSQTNPPKKFTIKKADWQKCHVAVGKESGR